MTAKDYTDLAAQANATLADNATRDISAADVRQMVIDVLDSVNESTLGILGWTVDAAGGFKDLIPTVDGQGIGSVDASPAFVAVGNVATVGLEGLMVARDDADGGGIKLLGFRGDPEGVTDPNAVVELSGAQIVLDGVLLLEVSNPVATDHILITKPSITLSDGRFVVPLALGPEYIPTNQEQATDVRSVAITPAATEIDILSDASATPDGALTIALAGGYPAGSTVSVALIIEETAGSSAIVTVTVKNNNVEVFSDTVNLQGNRFNYFISQPIALGVAQNDKITVHCDYINGAGGGTRTVLVRGDVATSTITIQDN